MTTRPALLAVCALSLAWITSSAVYLYPGVKEEVDEKRYLHRVEKLHTPVLPLECGRARGVEIETSFGRTGTRKGAGRRSRPSIRYPERVTMSGASVIAWSAGLPVSHFRKISIGNQWALRRG